MPDGIDQAARAFQTEIAPVADRSRDDQGRFATTQAKPEPMFQERPVEGDPLTGDTRDGGENARYAEHERRLADGWSEERHDDRRPQSRRSSARGDEPLSDGEARARSAGVDEGHERADPKPAGSGEEKPGDQDGEGPDEGSGPEGTPEPDAEGEAWQVTLNGKPVDKFEVQVGGETKQVSFNEALKGYVDGAELTKRYGELDQHRQAIDRYAGEVSQVRQTYQARLDYIGRVMADLMPQQPNWDQEFAADPRAAHEKQKMFGHVTGRIQFIAQEMQREAAEADAEYRRSEAAYAQWGKEEFKRRVGITDTPTLNNVFGVMRKAGLDYGFSEQELATVYDPRMLAVLRDASEYRRMTANKPRPVMPDQGRTLAPGSARPISGSAARRSIDDALKNQARSGSIDDTTRVFERLIR